MKPLNDLDKKCLMTIDVFEDCCKSKSIIDYDGFGYYATSTEVSDICANPSDFVKGIIRRDFTHVCWYNK